jgi:hypothetical protein
MGVGRRAGRRTTEDGPGGEVVEANDAGGCGEARLRGEDAAVDAVDDLLDARDRTRREERDEMPPRWGYVRRRCTSSTPSPWAFTTSRSTANPHFSRTRREPGL